MSCVKHFSEFFSRVRKGWRKYEDLSGTPRQPEAIPVSASGRSFDDADLTRISAAGPVWQWQAPCPGQAGRAKRQNPCLPEI